MYFTIATTASSPSSSTNSSPISSPRLSPTGFQKLTPGSFIISSSEDGCITITETLSKSQYLSIKVIEANVYVPETSPKFPEELILEYFQDRNPNELHYGYKMLQWFINTVPVIDSSLMIELKNHVTRVYTDGVVVMGSVYWYSCLPRINEFQSAILAEKLDDLAVLAWYLLDDIVHDFVSGQNKIKWLIFQHDETGKFQFGYRKREV